MRKLMIGLTLVAVAAVGTAAKAAEISESVTPRTRPLVELGLSLGTPAGLNVSAGLWGTSSVPLMARVSGMYFGQKLSGIQGDLGILFNPDGNFKHYLAISGMSTSGQVNSFDNFDWKGLGPAYGFNWYGFSMQAGLSFGSSSIASTTRYNSPQLQVQLGYSFLF